MDLRSKIIKGVKPTTIKIISINSMYFSMLKKLTSTKVNQKILLPFEPCNEDINMIKYLSHRFKASTLSPNFMFPRSKLTAHLNRLYKCKVNKYTTMVISQTTVPRRKCDLLGVRKVLLNVNIKTNLMKIFSLLDDVTNLRIYIYDYIPSFTLPRLCKLNTLRLYVHIQAHLVSSIKNKIHYCDLSGINGVRLKQLVINYLPRSEGVAVKFTPLEEVFVDVFETAFAFDNGLIIKKLTVTKSMKTELDNCCRRDRVGWDLC